MVNDKEFSAIVKMIDELEQKFATDDIDLEEELDQKYQEAFIQEMGRIGFFNPEDIKKFINLWVDINEARVHFLKEIIRAHNPDMEENELKSAAFSEMHSSYLNKDGLLSQMPAPLQGKSGEIKTLRGTLLKQRHQTTRFIQERREEQSQKEQAELYKNYKAWPFDFYEDDYPSPNP